MHPLHVLFETLPGWPTVQEPSLMQTLWVILGVPMLIAIPIFLLGLGPAWFRQSREPSGSEVAVPSEGVDD